MKVYCCFSLYNLYIAVAKAMVQNEKIDLVIGSQMPDYKNKIETIKSLDFINDIYVFDSVDYKNIKYKNIFDKIVNQKNYENKYINTKLKIDWTKYKDNIFLFNDFEILGWYFVNNQIRYHLIEDGLNFFKYFNKYYQVNKVDYDINSLKVRLKNKLNIGHRAFGTNQYVIDIEVNDKNGLAIDRENIIEIPRKGINDKLTLQQKKLIYGIFCKQKIINNNCNKTLLLCTQPLSEDGQLQNLEQQMQIYEDIIKEYTGMGYTITIKPHPRDKADYSNLCEKYNCLYIDKYIPTEVLNYDDSVFYDLALSITTPAIETLEFVRERKYLGFEFLERYK